MVQEKFKNEKIHNKKLFIKYINEEVEFGLFTKEFIASNEIIGRWTGVI